MKDSVTPNKPSGILNLLSNLNGLTPEGMAYLMETQERQSLTKTATHKHHMTNLTIVSD